MHCQNGENGKSRTGRECKDPLHSENFDRHDHPNGSRIYKPKKPHWLPTSITMQSDYDVSELRDVYINGVRFVRAVEYHESCEVVE